MMQTIQQMGGMIPVLGGDIFKARQQLLEAKRKLSASQSGGFDDVQEKDITIPGRDGVEIPARWYASKKSTDKGRPLVVLFHGGGWALGGLENEELNARRFARLLNCVCINVDYRLAPEHPFPASINDCWDSVKWVRVSRSGEPIDTG